jgi:hypothetical protein
MLAYKIALVLQIVLIVEVVFGIIYVMIEDDIRTDGNSYGDHV